MMLTAEVRLVMRSSERCFQVSMALCSPDEQKLAAGIQGIIISIRDDLLLRGVFIEPVFPPLLIPRYLRVTSQ